MAQQDLPGASTVREPGERALTWLSAGWVDLELVVVPVVVRLDRQRMKRISLLLLEKERIAQGLQNTLFWKKMSLFENSMRTGRGLSLSLWQFRTCSSYLGAQVKLQGFKY